MKFHCGLIAPLISPGLVPMRAQRGAHRYAPVSDGEGVVARVS